MSELVLALAFFSISLIVQASEQLALRKYRDWGISFSILQWTIIGSSLAMLACLIAPTPPLVQTSIAAFWIFGVLSTCKYWSGSFQGGSDALTLMSALSFATILVLPLLGAKTAAVEFFFALSVVLSYFRAGVAKLMDSHWRSGSALRNIFSDPGYACPELFDRLCKTYPGIFKSLGWSVIGFELGFPLVMIFSETLGYFLTIGILFHLGNFWVFGLNRFFWAWLATYPILWKVFA